MKVLQALKVGLPGAVVATLCCLSPLVLVLCGLGASSFSVVLFTRTLAPYEWLFFVAGALLLAASIVLYFRGRGVCTLSEAKARQGEVVNTIVLVAIVALVSFIALYGAVGAIGQRLGLWTSGA